MDYNGEKFLDKLYQNLYMSDEVQHTKENSDNRAEAIRKYLERLERVHKKADTETKKELLESMYYNKYVIKEENISNRYDKEAIINGQKKSLKIWLDYLSNETANYPVWAKYWAFQGMLKMGSYDEAKGAYLKRDKKTMSPFVSANPEIIAKSIEAIIKMINKEQVDDKLEEEITKNDSFSKIYALYEKKYKENVVEKSESTDGKWIKYNQGNKEEAKQLSKILEGKNTGWCTASEDMAIQQICGPYDDAPDGGDFYVYYTKDKKGQYNIPRIAIRLIDKNYIGEIRGIEEGQNLEEDMLDILESKLKEMTFLNEKDVKDNLEKVEGLKELTRINKKTENNEKLTEEELENLYTRQYGFGWTQDSKVGKVQEKRNKLDDYNSLENKELKVEFLTRGLLPKGTTVDDKEIVLEAVKQNSNALEYANEELKNDKEVVLETVKKNGYALYYSSEELKNDREVVLEAVKQNGNALLYASEELKNNKEFMLEAVKQNGYALKFAHEDLRKDRDVVLEAVKQDGRALYYASEELKNDKEVVLEAVKQHDFALFYASEELKNNKEFMLEAVKQYGNVLEYASEELKNDREVVLEAVKQSGYALYYASKELKNDKEFMLEIEQKTSKTSKMKTLKEKFIKMTKLFKNKDDNDNTMKMGFIDILSISTLSICLAIMAILVIKILN